jgi:hypothetical protein
VTVLTVSRDEKDLSKFALAIQQIAAGRSNAVGTFTCTQNQATTTVTDANCASGSTVLYMPTTANASAEVGAGTIYIGTVSNGSFVVTHANSATANRTFRYSLVG